MTFLYSIKRKKAQKLVIKKAFYTGNMILMMRNDLNPELVIKILTPVLRIEHWYFKRDIKI